MRKFLHLILYFFAISVFSVHAQVNIANLSIPYTQDFNTLASTGVTGTVLPAGWFINETGSNANTSYGIDNGAANSGNTYSYGTTGSSERALGSLESSSLRTMYGVNFTNSSGSNITTITVNYTGEQWRLGTAGRKDTINFQYSLDATSLATGTWIDENNLDFTSPFTATPTGALDGNAATNRSTVSFIITGLNIPNGSSFWLKWDDADATGADDGLAIDDITINFNGTVTPACSEPAAQPTALTLIPSPTSIDGSFTAANPEADEYLVIRSNSASLTQLPVDGVSYVGGQTIGNGIIVSSGSATDFIDAGLSPNTIYHYFIFSSISDACTGGPNYLTASPLNNTATTPALAACTTPAASPTNLTLTASNNSISGSFTAVSGANRYLVVRSTNSSLGATPANGTTYTEGQSLGNGTVVSYESATTFVTTGLNVSTTYYFFVFAANAECSGEPFYRTIALTGNTVTTNSSTGIPAGYYSAITTQTCAPLKTALKNIIRANTTVLTYTPGVLEAFGKTDIHRNDANTADIIWDMYSDNPTGPEPYTFTYYVDRCGNYAKEGDCYNREHSFPQEWFGSKQLPMYTDMHHIFPTDGTVNGMHASFPYGEVSNPTQTSLNGSKLGPNTYGGFTGTVFEPINAYKGDIARAQLYMVTRYEDSLALFNGNGNASSVLDGLTYPSFDDWYIKLLYKWHLQDPVSQKEIDRNNAIYALQGNRNPFIDHPEYVEMIWRCSVVPVTLIDFTVTKNNQSAVLKWLVTKEKDFSNYVVERSIDGIHFTETAVIPANNLTAYSFKDNKLPVSSTIFYRVKMVDQNGKFTYTKIVAVTLDNIATKVTIYPNPISNNLSIKLKQPLAANSKLRVLDITGRTLINQLISIDETNVNIDVRKLPSGKYFLSIQNNTDIINESFIIVK